ncbi:hypothetical protein M231_06550 [Tremella mesenterica]|uniref:Uncharacterized protein n=1 Tax=Tremella mesenterica TaxID=5217 RepID=A0A4Q1BDS0_TREME|nr:hypothetical protein M231_06550 [Tremella mesenterica]
MIAPVDLPPPRPESDPREPDTPRRGTRTPHKTHSPRPSRTGSPSRSPIQTLPLSGMQRSPSSDGPPLLQPIPKHLSSPSAPGGSPVPIHPPYPHHLSRPSSPASIHSSTSAIFERDIEPAPVASLSINPNPATAHTLHHKPSRLHGSAMDQAVPAALLDAVEALRDNTPEAREKVEIEAPSLNSGLGMARQSSSSLQNISTGRRVSTSPVVVAGQTAGFGTIHSRSPSPTGAASRGSSLVASPWQSPPILGQLQTQQLSMVSASPSTSPTNGVARPSMPGRVSTGPQVPGGWSNSFTHSPPLAFVGEKEKEEGHQEDLPSPALAPTPPTAIPNHLTPKEKRRVSFISYNDLLLSVPTSITSLGDITSGNLSPDHLPGTISPNLANRSPVVAPNLIPLGGNDKSGPSWEPTGRVGGLGLEAEWDREGLGKGLEQRLEDLAVQQSK